MYGRRRILGGKRGLCCYEEDYEAGLDSAENEYDANTTASVLELYSYAFYDISITKMA